VTIVEKVTLAAQNSTLQHHMKLEKLTSTELHQLSKKYFYLGFLFLPFVWVLNVVWIFPFLIQKREYQNYNEIKRILIYSLIGAILWIIGITIWISLYLTNRNIWTFADFISVFIPQGY
jgi:presenilin enhancer 2